MTANVYRLAFLVKAAREGTRKMNAALRNLGLTAPQAEALSVLAQAGPLSLNELGGLLIAEGGHPSRMVDRLVSAGWVAREEAADDRRRVTLRLTPAGERLHIEAAGRAATIYASVAERFEGADGATACTVLSTSATTTRRVPHRGIELDVPVPPVYITGARTQRLRPVERIDGLGGLSHECRPAARPTPRALPVCPRRSFHRNAFRR